MYTNNSIEIEHYVTHLEIISRRLSIFIYLFYIIIGNIGTIFKILFFLQKPVRTCPCTAYIIAGSIIDLITLNNIPILTLLSNLYPLKNWIQFTTNRSILSILSNNQNEELLFLSSKTITICKVRNYIHMWSTDVSIQLLVFASINRYFTSLKKLKKHTNKRFTTTFCKFSNAVKISLSTYVIGALISIHHYFNFTVLSNFCMPKYFILWAIWILDAHCLIPTIFMIIFSTLTLINVRKSSSSLTRHYGNTYKRKFNIPKRRRKFRKIEPNHPHIEHQLTSMIITEIILTILTSLPYAIYVTYQAMRTQNFKNVERLDLIEQLMSSTVYLEPSCGFYIYLFTLTTLRKRFIQLLLKKIRFI